MIGNQQTDSTPTSLVHEVFEHCVAHAGIINMPTFLDELVALVREEFAHRLGHIRSEIEELNNQVNTVEKAMVNLPSSIQVGVAKQTYSTIKN